jgi:hypothetical protein
MKIFPCPSCGAEIRFTSNVTLYSTCFYCQSLVVRQDIDVAAVGNYGSLPPDMSPFQTGTTGLYNSTAFTILGRIIKSWEGGRWNEWYVLFDDGTPGWLAEAQGFYAISKQSDFNQNATHKDFFTALYASIESNQFDTTVDTYINTYLSLNNCDYVIHDIKQATITSIEGEIPRKVLPNQTILSLDLLGAEGEFACFELHEKLPQFFSGHYCSWNELQCNGFREFEGW